MPKLQRRLAVQHQQKMKQQQQKNYQSSLLKKADAIQGSDSGISMSSQDVQDMVELLQLPFVLSNVVEAAAVPVPIEQEILEARNNYLEKFKKVAESLMSPQ